MRQTKHFNLFVPELDDNADIEIIGNNICVIDEKLYNLGQAATTTSAGLMTAADKVKLNNMVAYEEGTWTPQLMNCDLLEKVGHYIRVGNLCFLQGALRVKNDINGTFVISNPPFFTGTSDSEVARRWVYYQDQYNYTGDGSYSVLGRYKSSTNISASKNGTGSNQGDVICTGSFFTLCPDDTEYGEGASVFLKANTYIEFNLLYSLMDYIS